MLFNTIAAVVVFVVLILIAAAGFAVWKKRKGEGFKETEFTSQPVADGKCSVRLFLLYFLHYTWFFLNLCEENTRFSGTSKC